MKKKFYIYSALLAIAIIANFCFSTFCNTSQAIDGFTKGYEDAQKRHGNNPNNEYYCNMERNHLYEDVSRDSIKNKETGEYLPVLYTKACVIVQTPSKNNTGIQITTITSVLFMFFSAIAIFISAISLFRSINKKDIFSPSFELRITILGFSIIADFIGCTMYDMANLICARKYVDLKGFSFDYDTFDHIEILYLGIMLLIVAQVFKMARTLKEEQELTI